MHSFALKLLIRIEKYEFKNRVAGDDIFSNRTKQNHVVVHIAEYQSKQTRGIDSSGLLLGVFGN